MHERRQTDSNAKTEGAWAFRFSCEESGWRDLNPRPFDPQSNALPSCATTRDELGSVSMCLKRREMQANPPATIGSGGWKQTTARGIWSRAPPLPSNSPRNSAQQRGLHTGIGHVTSKHSTLPSARHRLIDSGHSTCSVAQWRDRHRRCAVAQLEPQLDPHLTAQQRDPPKSPQLLPAGQEPHATNNHAWIRSPPPQAPRSTEG